jgi:hypothetical protein
MPPTSDPGGSTPVPAPSSALVLGSGLAAGVAWLWGRGIRDNLRALIERLAGRETR